MKRNKRVHVMLDVVLHVHQKERKDGIQSERSAAHSVIPNILLKASVLQHDEHPLDACAVEPGKSIQEHWDPAVEVDRQPNDEDMRQQSCPGQPEHRLELVFWNIFTHTLGDDPQTVQNEVPNRDRTRVEVEEVKIDLRPVRWATERDFRIHHAHHGIGMVPGMTPAELDEVAKLHAATNEVEHVVEPVRPKWRSMTALMPTVVGTGVHDPVDDEKRNRPPAAPTGDRRPTQYTKEGEPGSEAQKSRPVLSRQICSELLPWNIGFVPFLFIQPLFRVNHILYPHPRLMCWTS